jgi:hypothetical protein
MFNKKNKSLPADVIVTVIFLFFFLKKIKKFKFFVFQFFLKKSKSIRSFSKESLTSRCIKLGKVSLRGRVCIEHFIDKMLPVTKMLNSFSLQNKIEKKTYNYLSLSTTALCSFSLRI